MNETQGKEWKKGDKPFPADVEIPEELKSEITEGYNYLISLGLYGVQTIQEMRRADPNLADKVEIIGTSQSTEEAILSLLSSTTDILKTARLYFYAINPPEVYMLYVLLEELTGVILTTSVKEEYYGSSQHRFLDRFGIDLQRAIQMWGNNRGIHLEFSTTIPLLAEFFAKTLHLNQEQMEELCRRVLISYRQTLVYLKKEATGSDKDHILDTIK